MAFPLTRLSCSFLLVLAACGTSTDGASGRTDDQTSGAQATSTKRDAGAPKKVKDAAPPSHSEPSDTDDQGQSSATDGGGKKAGGSADKLPCEVQAVLTKHCAECHGNPTKFGAPFSLVTRADLKATVADKEGKTRLELALERVQDDAMPMPPAPAARLTPSEIETLQTFLDTGYPASDSDSCATATAGQDGGTVSMTPGIEGNLPKPDDCENTYELRAHGGTSSKDKSRFKTQAELPLQGNQYQCFYFDPPYGSDAGMYWFESIIDNTKNLHHWILYATDNKKFADGTTAGCNASEPGAYFVAGWAPGANNGAATPDVALNLPSGPKAGLILEVHYFNNEPTPVEDGSGIRFCTGKKSGRPHLASVHSLGTEGICLSPGTKTDVTGTCVPRTDMGDIHITGVWPHMHKTARNMKVVINRADGTKQVIHDKPFDFGSQIFYPLTDIVVHKGDTLETTCTYQNDTTGQIHFGERTQDEMCYAFTAAWPAGSLTNMPSPLSDPSTELINHCGDPADPLPILKSCNGIADRPVDVTPSN